MQRYAVRTRADSPELRKAAMAIEQAAWSALGFLNFTRAHFAFYQQLLEDHADCQLCLVDEATGYPVAVGNCVPLACDFDNLPPEGWDWIVETAANDSRQAAQRAGRARHLGAEPAPRQGRRAHHDPGVSRAGDGQGPRWRHRAGAPVRETPPSVHFPRRLSRLDRRQGPHLRPLAAQPSLRRRQDHQAGRALDDGRGAGGVLGKLDRTSLRRLWRLCC